MSSTPITYESQTQPQMVTQPESKKWFVVAIAVGAFLVLAGIFGALGLLQSSISFPSFMTAAFKVVGNTPHLWSLWTIAGVGIVGGGALIVFGSLKIKKENHYSKFYPSIKSGSYYQAISQQCESIKNNEFAIIKDKIIFNTDNQLKTTNSLTNEQQIQLIEQLESKQFKWAPSLYKDINAQLDEALKLSGEPEQKIDKNIPEKSFALCTSRLASAFLVYFNENGVLKVAKNLFSQDSLVYAINYMKKLGYTYAGQF